MALLIRDTLKIIKTHHPCIQMTMQFITFEELLLKSEVEQDKKRLD